MRSHGWLRNIDSDYFLRETEDISDERYEFHNWGFNLRPTEVQAAFGIKQLEKLKDFNIKREELSSDLLSFLASYSFLQPITIHNKAKPSWLGIPIILKENAPFNTKELISFLEGSGIETRPILTGNILRQPVSKKLFPGLNKDDFPGAETIHKRGIYIGLSPITNENSHQKLKLTLKNFFDRFQRDNKN